MNTTHVIQLRAKSAQTFGPSGPDLGSSIQDPGLETSSDLATLSHIPHFVGEDVRLLLILGRGPVTAGSFRTRTNFGRGSRHGAPPTRNDGIAHLRARRPATG